MLQNYCFKSSVGRCRRQYFNTPQTPYMFYNKRVLSHFVIAMLGKNSVITLRCNCVIVFFMRYLR